MATKTIAIKNGVVYVDREDGKTIAIKNGVVYVNQDTPAGGLSIPIAAYHYNIRLKG